MYTVDYSAFPQEHVVHPVCFAESIPCAQMVDAFSCGPWAVITFCQLFVKVNDLYVRHIAQSPPPFAVSNNFSTPDRKQCLDFMRLTTGI